MEKMKRNVIANQYIRSNLLVRKLLVDCDKNIKKRQSYLIILNQSIKILILFILFEYKNDKELSK